MELEMMRECLDRQQGEGTGEASIQHGKVAVQLGLVAHGGQLGIVVILKALGRRHGGVLVVR